MSRDLVLWTIYDHPVDYPNDFVARAHAIRRGSSEPTDQVIFAPDLEALRALLRQHGLYCLGRQADDQPQIVESWI